MSDATYLIVSALAGLVGLAAIPVQAAPLSPAATSVELGTGPSIELVRQGCGWDGTAPTGVTARAIGTGGGPCPVV
jgi:hypothetical protein